MSLAKQINEVQRINFIVMENIASVDFDKNIGHKNSSKIFTDLIKESIPYRNDKMDFCEIEYQNKSICVQLIDGEISPQEAAIQSNSLWIDFIN